MTLKASDNPDTMTFTFESINQERTTEFDMKLMDIDSEHLSVDDMDYQAVVEMPSAEFQRICRDLGAGVDGDSVWSLVHIFASGSHAYNTLGHHFLQQRRCHLLCGGQSWHGLRETSSDRRS